MLDIFQKEILLLKIKFTPTWTLQFKLLEKVQQSHRLSANDVVQDNFPRKIINTPHKCTSQWVYPQTILDGYRGEGEGRCWVLI